MTKAASKFINRELSWLDFNQRVLNEAQDANVPLLERLKFLAITGSNLDEFFMVRVGGLQILRERGITKLDPSGMTPAEQLEAISQRARRMMLDQYRCFMDEIEPRLAEAGIKRIRRGEMSERQQHVAEQIFSHEIFPIMSPIAVILPEQFPQLINQTLNICARLGPDPKGGKGSRFAIIPFGRLARRFITLPADRGYAYTPVEDAVSSYVERFFPGERVLESAPFRITRNADIAIQDDSAADLLADMEELLVKRKRSDCVRLETTTDVSPDLLEFLTRTLEVDVSDVFQAPGPLALSDFMQLTDLKGFESLRNESWPPQPSPDVDPTKSMFDVLAKRDVLLVHPYEGFDPVVRLIEEAADDPDVLAIKQTLYRTSRNSPIVAALARAARRGKYVTALVELKARFDEARNIEWGRQLEQADVQVIYGVRGLKTHAKVCVIVRREPRGFTRYVHFGTGNYNEATARIYSDVSLMSCNEELGADATTFFNAMTGYSQPQPFRKIEMAPLGLRDKLLEMIEAEARRRQQGQRAHLVAKFNSLADTQIIEALYAASNAGVSIKLNVRGICCLLPGVPGMSENIEVVSIVDRFLEHARILYFYHGGDERVFISSADWMPRNLDGRVELLVPVEDVAARRRLISILDIYFRDNLKASRLLPDGTYERIRPRGRRKGVASQELLYRETVEALQRAKQAKTLVFEPHRAPQE
jgi:polyphosphate kinase